MVMPVRMATYEHEPTYDPWSAYLVSEQQRLAAQAAKKAAPTCPQ
jgi:hypothetical protein